MPGRRIEGIFWATPSNDKRQFHFRSPIGSEGGPSDPAWLLFLLSHGAGNLRNSRRTERLLARRGKVVMHVPSSGDNPQLGSYRRYRICNADKLLRGAGFVKPKKRLRAVDSPRLFILLWLLYLLQGTSGGVADIRIRVP
jgi:hypothetical protein